jgi:hypothetical protein
VDGKLSIDKIKFTVPESPDVANTLYRVGHKLKTLGKTSEIHLKFSKYDTGENFIKRLHFINVLKAAKVNEWDAEILASRFDYFFDGHVFYTEFMRCICSKDLLCVTSPLQMKVRETLCNAALACTQGIAELFVNFDRSKSGVLTRQDMQRGLRLHGLPLSFLDISKVINSP